MVTQKVAIGAILATSMTTLLAVPVTAAEIMPHEAKSDIQLETLQFHANGIVSKFWHDTKTVVLSGELVVLEEISKPDC